MAPTPRQNGVYRKAPAMTPSRRAVSAEPPSSRRTLHTPLDRAISRDILDSIRRGTPNRSNAPTPHAKAARRALDQRRNAMFTPGKNRRRSIQAQRETPLDILRNLGRALAPLSKPIITSSSSPDKPSPGMPRPQPLPEEEDELPIDRPRLSLPLDDSDDSDLLPHRSSMLEEGNYTVQSIELPRRAVSEQPSRMSLGVFGSDGISDFIMNNDPTEGLGGPADFFPGLLEDIQARQEEEQDDFSYERLAMDPMHRLGLGGRESDFNLEMPVGLEDQTTFVLSDPVEGSNSTMPIAEQAVVDASGKEERAPLEEDALSDDDNNTFQDYGDDMGDELLSDGGGGDDDGIMDLSRDIGLNEPGDDEHDSEDDDSDDLAMPGDGGVGIYYDDVERTRGSEEASDGNSGLRKKRSLVSIHGIEFPALPPAFVKRVAQTALQSSGLSSSRISRDTLEALTQASDWFFEQLGDDLGAYASHAKRKTIEEGDLMTLLRRQRQIGGESTPFSVAQRHLPRELLQELRMPVPRPAKQPRAKRRRAENGQDTVEIT